MTEDNFLLQNVRAICMATKSATVRVPVKFLGPKSAQIREAHHSDPSSAEGTSIVAPTLLQYGLTAWN